MVTNPQPSACRKTAPCDRACFVQRFEIAEEDATLPRDDGRLSTLITDRRIVHLHNVVKAISSFHDHSISRIRAWRRHELPSSHVFPANASGSLPYREQLVLHESSDRPTGHSVSRAVTRARCRHEGLQCRAGRPRFRRANRRPQWAHFVTGRIYPMVVRFAAHLPNLQPWPDVDRRTSRIRARSSDQDCLIFGFCPSGRAITGKPVWTPDAPDHAPTRASLAL